MFLLLRERIYASVKRCIIHRKDPNTEMKWVVVGAWLPLHPALISCKGCRCTTGFLLLLLLTWNQGRDPRDPQGWNPRDPRDPGAPTHC